MRSQGGGSAWLKPRPSAPLSDSMAPQNHRTDRGYSVSRRTFAGVRRHSEKTMIDSEVLTEAIREALTQLDSIAETLRIMNKPFIAGQLVSVSRDLRTAICDTVLRLSAL